MRYLTIFLAFVLCGLPLLAQVQTESFTISVTGQKTWSIRYGIGDPEALALENIYPGQLYLDQSLRADITGTALGFITLEASFDDQLGPGFQHFVLKLDRGPWHGELGDFYVGRGELGVYNKKLLGAKLSFQGDNYTLTGLAARLEGISETRTFRGKAAEATVTFSYEDLERPWEPAPYRQQLEGAYFWPLRAPFVEGFSEAKLSLIPGTGLWGFLADFDLGYLRDVLKEPDMALSEGDFLVLRDEGDVFLLRTSPEDLLRRRVQRAIEAYNELHNLSGPDRKVYPFLRGSELEQAFLQGLFPYAEVQVDGEAYPLPEAGRRRYLLLGERDVLPETLEIWLRPAGEGDFRPISDPAFSQFNWSLYPEEGVLRIDFPGDFFQEGAALRVSFQYQRSGDVFMLGLSVVPGSERVYLNGELLTRGTDYTIDYETGVLVLFVTLTEDDELRVDFERQRGGLGGYTEYERAFLGATLSAPGLDGLELSVYRAVDLGRPGPASRTMPNTHTVAGLRMSGESGGWEYALSLGGSENVFPPGDNERIAAPNRINDIAIASAPDGEYVVLAHQDGLTVYHDGEFYGYGGAEGLGGRAVYALLALPGRLLCATDSGFTVVHLWEEAPLDRVSSWVRIYPEDGFPGDEGLVLSLSGGKVYLATDQAVAVFSPEEAEDPEAWDTLTLPDESRPLALLVRGSDLYLGTETGLYTRTEGTWRKDPDIPGPVYDLLEREGTLYVATGQGIRVLRDGVGSGWLAAGTPVYSLAFWDGELWWAGEEGLSSESQPGPIVPGPFTALAANEALWAGTRASGDYQLDVWRLDPDPERFGQDVTHIEGRDLGHFRDAPAREHTARGLTGRLSLSRQMGGWDLSVEAGTRWPGYQAIGGTGSTDAHGIGFTARYQDEGVSTTLRGRWDIVDLFSSPWGRLSGEIDASWEGTPKLTLSLTPAFSEKEGRLEMGYRVGSAWDGDEISGSLSLAGNLAAPDWYTGGRLEGQLVWKPSAAWQLEARGLVPFRSRGRPGDEQLTLTTRWTEGSDLLSWTTTWTETIRHRSLEGTSTRESNLRVNLRWKVWKFEDGTFAPRVTWNWKSTFEETTWSFWATGRMELGQTSWQLGITFGQGFRPATERRERDLTMSLRWEYRGWEGLRPTLTWKRNWQVLTHPQYGERLSGDQEATLRISWEPEAPWRNDLTLTYKGRDGSFSVTDRFSWPLDVGTLGAQASATLKEGRLEGRVSGTYSQGLAEGWDMNLELGYAFGTNPERAFKQGLYLQLSLVATF